MSEYISYKQLILATGEVVRKDLPGPMSQTAMLQFLERLNSEPLVYGCVYYTTEDCRNGQPINSVTCRKCGASVTDAVWLERMNEKGVPGIWECRPDCITRLSPEVRVIAAIDGSHND